MRNALGDAGKVSSGADCDICLILRVSRGPDRHQGQRPGEDLELL
ncbi:hypothetical protein GZL_09312 [Streptomyces sp. 769]|nr:hypothetical protein GZL_00101 [Streptomyces sp. 769]AJC61830.1 hypothetical protein GZL_09312 [Streptomyces sp. 769]